MFVRHKDESYIYYSEKQQQVKQCDQFLLLDDWIFMTPIQQFHDLGIVVALLIELKEALANNIPTSLRFYYGVLASAYSSLLMAIKDINFIAQQ